MIILLKTKFQIIISTILLFSGVLSAQKPPKLTQTGKAIVSDTIPDPLDSLSLLMDSLFNVSFPNNELPPSPPPTPKGELLMPNGRDSVPSSPLGAGGGGNNNLSKITVSENAVEENVEYESQDSMYFDVKNKQIHLYGQAIVKYQTMTIEAEYIMIDWNDNTILADGRMFNGRKIGTPQFKEGEQTFGSE